MGDDTGEPTDSAKTDGADAERGNGTPTDATDGDVAFERELATARALLDDGAEDITALHVGVVRGEQVNSTAARRSEGEQAGLETLTLLASHLRTVADEAGVDYETVAADAARLAGEVEALPTDRPDADE